MQVIRGSVSEWSPLTRSVLSIGNFDGVHRGHRRIMRVAGAHSRRCDAPVVVMTFEPHPVTVLHPNDPVATITTSAEKLRLLEECAADYVYIADAAADLLAMTPEQFITTVVLSRFAPVCVVEGHNFGFGRGRTGDVDTLRNAGRDHGFDVVVVDPVMQVVGDQPQRVSSSLVRRLLLAGDVGVAAAALGRYYSIDAVVGRGAGRGVKLGFPTANLTRIDQLIPADGVYAGWANLGGEHHPAAISVGSTPTFAAGVRQVEAHILDFEGDVYERRIRIAFAHRLRPQQAFASADALREQISRDIDAVRAHAAGASSPGAQPSDIKLPDCQLPDCQLP